MLTNIISLVVTLVVMILLVIAINKFLTLRRLQKILVNTLVPVIGSGLLVFFSLMIWVENKVKDNRLIEVRTSINCENRTFKFQKQLSNIYQYSYISSSNTQDIDIELNELKPGNLVEFFAPSYQAIYSEYSDSQNNDTVNTLTILLRCKEYQIDTLYQKYDQSINNTNVSGVESKPRTSCYLANYTKATDYPDCPPEIKARFGL